MSDKASQFLHDRNPQFHAQQEVSGVVEYLQENGEKIPNQPADRITHYLGFLADKEYVNDGILTGDQESIDRQITAHVIKGKDVPKAYFDLQKRIARERGNGDIEITKDKKAQMIESIQADQKASLNKWVEYLGGDDGSYPNWFKHYAWDSVIKLGDYDKAKHAFQKRSKGTTAVYPELNREALAYTFNIINKTRIEEKIEIGENDDAKLHELLKSANFGKLYAHSVESIVHDSPELRNNTEGSWKKFDQTDDPRTARRLSESLAGHGTDWCTAGESTAKAQLEHGDFYVYYTQDAEGKETIPRIAVRMDYDGVAEVRGVEVEQNLEGDMVDIAMEKVRELPGGERYLKVAEDMKRLTDIDNKVKAGGKLNSKDILFLRYGDIEGFGYEEDPRIEELIEDRSVTDDLEILFKDDNPDEVYKALINSRRGPADLADNLDLIRPGVINHHDFANFLISPRETIYEDEDEVHFSSVRSRGELGIETIFRNLEKFEEGSIDFNKIFLDGSKISDDFYVVAKVVIDNFEEIPSGAIDQKRLVDAMLEGSRFEPLINNAWKFEEGVIDYDSFTNMLFEDKNNDSSSFGSAGIDIVRQNLPIFLQNVDHTELAKKFLYSREKYVLGHQFDEFLNGTDQKKLATTLIEEGQTALIARNLEKFEKGVIDHQKLANKLIEEGEQEQLADQLDQFEPGSVDHTKLARELIKQGNGRAVARNLDTFEPGSVDQIKLAAMLINKGDTYWLGKSLEKFDDLLKVIEKLSKD